MLRRLRPAWLAAFLKKLCNIQRIVIQTGSGDFRIDPISHFGHSIIGNGSYELAMMNVLKRFLHPGCTFVDVGANEGFFTILAGKLVGSAGRVIAVEPQSRLGPRVEDNIALNQLRNVQLVQVAVSDSEGVVQLYLSPDVNSGSSGLDRVTRYGVDSETIRSTTLAQILKEASVTQVQLMKMDIEGAEYEAILGSQELFRSGIVKALALELHPDIIRRRGHDPDRINSTLHECGYRPASLPGPAVYVWQPIEH
jgi:FkbM family methyltransferase